MHRHAVTGFTLIEILVVVVIIGILGAVIVPNLLGRPDQARITAAQSDIRSLANALDIYRLDNFQYPSTDQGLEALAAKPAGFPEPRATTPTATSASCRRIPGAHPTSTNAPRKASHCSQWAAMVRKAGRV